MCKRIHRKTGPLGMQVKLIILSWSNFDKRISEQFDLPYIIEKGANVEYWDVSEITIKGYKVKEAEHPKGLKIVKISDYKDFSRRVKDEGDSIFLVYMNYCCQSFRCYRLLSKYNCRQIYCVNGVLPSASAMSKYKQFFRKVSFNSIRKVSCRLMCSLIEKTFLIKAVDVMLKTCDNASNKGGCKVNNHTRIIPFNSLDYQQTLMTKDENTQNNRRYMVFLDQYLPFHPDNIMRGFTYDADDYYKRMNALFERIEKKFSCEVIIAGHPAVVNRKTYSEYYNNRKVEYDSTLKLIRGSLATIAHFSTAISFSVIYDKKIVFAFSEDMKIKSPVQYSTGKTMCEMLDGTFIYLSDNENYNLPSDLRINQYAYEDYKKKFLVNKETNERRNGEILIKLLNK